MNPNTGGPASEKTLLDEFAGRALTGYRSQATGNDFNLASECYDDAEAMLAEKARRETQPTERISIGSDDKRKALEALKLIENIDHPEFAAVRLAIANLASRFEVSKEADREFQATDHSPDAGKMAKLSGIPSESAIIRAGWDLFTWADKTMDETDECRVFLHNWREAVVLESSTTDHFRGVTKMIPDHSPDAGKMAKLEELNRELLEALEKFIEAGFGFSTSPAMRAEAYNKACKILAKAKEVA